MVAHEIKLLIDIAQALLHSDLLAQERVLSALRDILKDYDDGSGPNNNSES
jgi:hypothetical protein